MSFQGHTYLTVTFKLSPSFLTDASPLYITIYTFYSSWYTPGSCHDHLNKYFIESNVNVYLNTLNRSRQRRWIFSVYVAKGERKTSSSVS